MTSNYKFKKQLIRVLIVLNLMLSGLVWFNASPLVYAHEGDESENHLEGFFDRAIGQAGDLESEYELRKQQYEANRAEQDKLRAQIADTQARERTLQEQIWYFESRARLKELEIAEAENTIIDLEAQLVGLGEDIVSLQTKVGILDESIGRLRRAFYARVKSSYQSSFSPTISVFLNSEDFQTAVLRYAYLKNLQEEDNKFLVDLRETKDEYQKRTTQLEDLKNQKEQLKVELEGQKILLEDHRVQLAVERDNKAYLLQITNNEEAEYQRLLSIAQAESQAITDALNNVLSQITGRVLEGTRVYKGDLIGIQGNTGYSTGEHLHFGYYPCGAWSCASDPMGLFNNGTFLWPLDSYYISQGFGQTPFAQAGAYGYDAYGNPIGHNGVDMVGPSASAIRASHTGTIYYTVDGWGGHGAVLIDDSGYMTIYWHLRPRQ